jgi:hypothetical protein
LQKSGSWIGQTVDLPAGRYVLSFLAAQRPGPSQSSQQTFLVAVDGAVVATVTPSASQWHLYTTGLFAATAGSHTIQFVGQSPNDADNTAFLDQLQITQVSTLSPLTTDQRGLPRINGTAVDIGAFEFYAGVDGHGVLQVEGSNANDNMVLRPNPSDPSQTEVVDNGAVVGTFANASFSSIHVQLLASNLTLADTGGSSGLGFFAVPVTVDGGTGANTLTLDDSASSSANTYTVTSTTVSRSGFGGVTYANVGQLILADGSGTNTVNVLSTSANLIISTHGNDSVNVGSNGSSLGGNVQGINGAVIVAGYGGTSLSVDDSGDSTGRTATLSDGSITGLAPAPIVWIPTSSATGGVTGLNVYGGSGGNTFNVTGTSNFYSNTSLSTGTGNDTVNVENTTGTLSVYNPGGQDSVYVGSNGSALGGTVQGIGGAVTVYGPGGTNLTVDDSGDTTARTATLSDGSITGLAPAPIAWTPTSSATGGVTGLYVYGGSGGNTFNVTGTSNFSDITLLGTGTGTGNDTVNVENTSGTLLVYNKGGQDSVYVGSNGSALGGTVQGINGGVLVLGPGGTNLTVDDSGDTTARTATLSDGSITGLAPSTIGWVPTSIATGGVTGLNVSGGSGGNTFTVTGTSNFSTDTVLSTGTGNDMVNVENTTGALIVYNPGGQDQVWVGSNGSAAGGNVQGIGGAVIVAGPGGTALIVDDSSDTNARTATLSNSPFFGGFLGALTGLAPAPIEWVPTSSATGGVNEIAVYGGSGGSTYNVAGTSNIPYDTYLQTGAGNDAVNITATTGGLGVVNSGGTDSVVVGSLAPATTGGTLAAIQGFVQVFGLGATNLTIDDGGDTLGRTVTVTSAAVTGLGNPAPIEYGSGVSSLTVNGSQGASTYSVQSTQGGTATTINAGPANDTFNVGDATHALSGIQGALTLSGGGGTNTVALTDTAQTANETYVLSTTALTGGGMAGVGFTGMTGLTLNAGSGSVGLGVTAVATALPVTFNGGSGSDTLSGPNQNNTWAITGINAGKLTAATLTGTPLGTVSFSQVKSLDGGSVADLFKLSPGGSLSGGILGGSGIESLDYSAYTGAVQVILPLGMATGFAGGIQHIQNVTGSQGNNLIVGDANNNVLMGGTGRNILIGGGGSNTLDASGATTDNIVIGGTTDYDANLAALDAIFAEWTRTDLNFRDRFSDLTSGTNGQSPTPLNQVNGQIILLTSLTVHANSSPDTLIGSNHIDPAIGKRVHNWFFYDADDTLSNFLSSSDHQTKAR